MKGKIVTAIVLLALGAGGLIWGMTNLKPGTITVSGKGTVSVKPGKVSLIVSAVSVNTSVQAAIDANEHAMDQLVGLAKVLGGESAEINKSVYQITTQGGQYVVANGLSLKSDKVDQVNDIVKQFYQAGATAVTNISFSPENPDATEQQARLAAVENARNNALKIAGSVGKRLGRVVTISEDQAGADSVISNANVSNNAITVAKTVSVAYEIW